MIDVIQSVYILILNMVYHVTGKIDKRVRNAIIWLFSFLLISLCIFNYSVWSREASTVRFERDIIGCIYLAVIAVFSIDGVLKKVEWNRLFMIIWYGLAGMMFLSGCLHSVGNSYWLWSVSMLAGFPGFYLIWQNRKDYQTLFNIISSVMLVELIVCFVICLMTVDSNEFINGRYLSFMLNPNHLGKLAASGMIAALYLSLQREKSWIYGVVCGICIKLAVLSGSRAALVVMGAQLIVYFVFHIKSVIRDRMYSRTAVNLGIFLVLLCVCFWGYGKCLEYYQAVHEQEQIAEQMEKQQAVQEPEEAEPHRESQKVKTSAEVQTADESTEMPITEESAKVSVPEKAVPSGGADINNTEVLEERLAVEGKTLDQFTSGRVGIWKHLLKKTNLLGNDWKKYKSGTPEYTYQWAHNDIVEITYRSGVVAGIFEILFLVYLSAYILKILFSKQKVEMFHCFIILSILAYGGYAMMDVISFPFSQQYTFMTFASLMPLFERERG